MGYGEDVVYGFGRTLDDRKKYLEGAKRLLQENLEALAVTKANAEAIRSALENFAAVWEAGVGGVKITLETPCIGGAYGRFRLELPAALEEALRTLKGVSSRETHYALSKGGWVPSDLGKALEHQEGPTYSLEFWGSARDFAAELVRRATQLPQDARDWASSFEEAAEGRVRQAEAAVAEAERDLAKALEGAE